MCVFQFDTGKGRSEVTQNAQFILKGIIGIHNKTIFGHIKTESNMSVSIYAEKKFILDLLGTLFVPRQRYVPLSNVCN